MDKYYYLVAQLPMLFFDVDPGITTGFFLDEAEKWMPPADLAMLKNSRLMDASARGPVARLARDYQSFERRFTDDLVKWRKARRNRQEYQPSFPPALVKEGNPLEVEKKLLRHRWVFIEELSVGHHFDLDFLSGYYLQLQILKKSSLFNKEKGMSIFKHVCGKTE
jgi:hypothetical protein